MSDKKLSDTIGHIALIEGVDSMTGADSIAPGVRGRSSEQPQQYVPAPGIDAPGLQREVERALFRQGALLDAQQWQAFIDGFTSDGVYWMPASPDQTDWLAEASIFAEDRMMMTIRRGRLEHPNAWSQAAEWGTNHLIGNVIIESASDTDVHSYARFQMMEQRRETARHFAGSYRHHWKRTEDGLKIKLQRVEMINAQSTFDYVLQAWV